MKIGCVMAHRVLEEVQAKWKRSRQGSGFFG
jgi:hypothetical protein